MAGRNVLVSSIVMMKSQLALAFVQEMRRLS